MLSNERIAEIKRKLNRFKATFGRGSFSLTTEDVSDLLDEREELVRELETLRTREAKVVEKTWRLVLRTINEFMGMNHSQRTYGWHEIQDAHAAAINAVKKSLPVAPEVK